MSILIWVVSDLKELRKAVRNTGGVYSRQEKHPEQPPKRKCVKLWLGQGGPVSGGGIERRAGDETREGWGADHTAPGALTRILDFAQRNRKPPKIP